MIRHFFLDKTNTIVKGSVYNCGLNPVMQIGYGKNISRGLLHFEIDDLRQTVHENVSDRSKLSFMLHMTNCAGIDSVPYHDTLLRGKEGISARATSFSIMLVKLPCYWDQGKGFDFESDFWIQKRKADDAQGSNWYHSTTNSEWNIMVDSSVTFNYGGVYTNEYLERHPELVVACQHFDFGDEDINMDITEYVLSLIDGEENNGLMAMVANDELSMDGDYVVDFFTNHTNTFFHPYVKMKYDEYIMDDREAFYIGKENKLYLYAKIGGRPQNLDSGITCEINGNVYPVEKAQKGTYFARIKPLRGDMVPDSIHYDKWSNLALNGEKIDDVEMEFVAHDSKEYYRVGEESAFEDRVVPSIYGINENENVIKGEIREIIVDFRKKFTTDKKALNCNAEYRIYIKDGNREYTVFEFSPVEKSFLNNFFMIYSADFIPGKYYIDIKMDEGRTTRLYKDVIHFNIVSEVRERYE